jgi:hypothetical protein
MTVVRDDSVHEPWDHTEGTPCTFCGDPVTFPYIGWMAHGRLLFVCMRCAPEILRGFGRDLRELAALQQFRVWCGRPAQPGEVRQ